MDTKLKKRKPFLTLSVFLVSLLGILFCSATFIYLYNSNTFAPSYLDQYSLRNDYQSALQQALYFLSEKSSLSEEEYEARYGEHELSYNKIHNIKADEYYDIILQDIDGTIYSNLDNVSFDQYLNHIKNQPDDFHYYVMIDDGRMDEYVSASHNTYKQLTNYYYREPVKGILAIPKTNPFALNEYDSGYQHWLHLRQFAMFCIAAGVVCLFLFIWCLFKRQSRKLASAKLSKSFSHILLEIKLLIQITLFCILCIAYTEIFCYWDYPDILFVVVSGIYIILLWIYCIAVDVKYNKKQIFTHSLLGKIIRAVKRKYQSEKDAYQERIHSYPFQKRMYKQLREFFILESIIILTALFLIVLAISARSLGTALVFMVLAGCAVFFSAKKFFTSQMHFTNQLGQIVDKTTQMKNGEIISPIQLKKDDELYLLAENINSIEEGIGYAVEQKVASDRMKVELITNVSHDLKTPLTSIINYSDLLLKEKLQPEEANSYAAVLNKKALRLKDLVEDLFEISKANSGTIEMHIEKLNLSQLLQQTLAELERRLELADLKIVTHMPDEAIYIWADGRRLHRVFENLLGNALKYSLKGTRIFLDVYTQEQNVYISFKNISNYEMDFQANEVLERFVRGDKARSSEGSGLGLAIADSLLALQNGTLEVSTDGDLFKAVVTLKIAAEGENEKSFSAIPKPPEKEAIPEQETPAEQIPSMFDYE